MKEGLTVELANQQILGYAEYGSAEGVPIFYFHGWPGSSIQARLTHAAAAERGIRIIAPDRPGLGRSSHQLNRVLHDWPDTLSQFAEKLSLQSFHILAVSGGGPYGVVCAAKELPGLQKVGICCGAPELATIQDLRDWFWPYRCLIYLSRTAPNLLKLMMASGRQLINTISDPKRYEPFLRLLPQVDRDAVLANNRWPTIFESIQLALLQTSNHLLEDGMLYLDPWEIDFEKIRVPIHYWHGVLDRNLPLAFANATIDRIPSATLDVFPEDGHYSLPLNHNERILDWFLS